MKFLSKESNVQPAVFPHRTFAERGEGGRGKGTFPVAESSKRAEASAVPSASRRRVRSVENGGVLKERRSLRRRDGGYTLLELAVTLFIILTITAISRFGKTEYERSLVLTNLAYDIALSVRQAQTYGVNTRQADVTSTASFDVGYGVRFTTTDPVSFCVFLDANSNRYFDNTCTNVTPNPDVVVRSGTYKIGNNNKISSICLVPAGSASCSVSASVLNITFRRPDPDACLNPAGAVTGGQTASDCQSQRNYSEARITVESPPTAGGSRTKIIKVYSTGQVSVQ